MKNELAISALGWAEINFDPKQSGIPGIKSLSHRQATGEGDIGRGNAGLTCPGDRCTAGQESRKQAEEKEEEVKTFQAEPDE